MSLRRRIRFLWSFGAVYAVVLMPLAWLPGRRMVTFVRGSLVEQERAKGAGPLRISLARAVEWLAARSSHRIVVVSSDLASRMGTKAEVLPNDAKADLGTLDQKAARRALHLPLDLFLVGYAGAVVSIKSLETLLDAVERTPNVHLVLMGFLEEETAYARKLKNRISDSDLGARTFCFPWDADVSHFLSAVDVTVLPSRHEGCPNLLLEAMVRGRPVLGARVGGIEEVLVHEELLFPWGDVEALAIKLMRLRDDVAEGEKLSALARERVRGFEFDWEERAARLLQEAFTSGPVP